jgi:hypothetical protein
MAANRVDFTAKAGGDQFGGYLLTHEEKCVLAAVAEALGDEVLYAIPTWIMGR